jgi:outer membrane protein assembly factor BamB
MDPALVRPIRREFALSRTMSRAKASLVGLAVVGSTVLAVAGSGAGRAAAATPSHFATIDDPVGVASTPNALLVTGDCSFDVSSVDSAGTVTVFATLPSAPRLCQERYIAVSPGLGAWPRGYVYVTQNHRVYQISPDGSQVTQFAKIPQVPVDSAGVTFDRIGALGFDMIVTGHDGGVWRVDSSGHVSLLANVGVQIEGPAVAPAAFAPFGGDVLLATKFDNEVLAVAPDGTVSQPVALDHDAEQIVPVPPSRCDTFGGGAWFLASEEGAEILRFPASDFAAMTDADALAQSELQMDVFLLSSSGGVVTAGTFSPPLGTPPPDGEGLEGSAFTDCSSVSVAPSTGGAGSAAALSGSGFDPGETVAVTFDGASVGSGVAASDGTVSVPVTIPASASPGKHTLLAHGISSGVTNASSFFVPTNWPTFHFSSGRTGLNPTESVLGVTNVAGMGVRWTATTSGPVRSSPVVAEGLVYAGSDDGTMSAFPTSCAGACAPVWTATPDAGFAIESTPAVSGGFVFVGSDDGKVYAYNAATGAFKWSAVTTSGSPIRSSPLVSGNTVYVGSDDGKLYAFKANSGKLLWTGATTGGLPVRSSPALSGSTVYVGADDGNVYAFPATCTNPCSPTWVGTTAAGVPVRSTPAVGNGQLFVGSDNGRLFAFPTTCTTPCAKQWSKATGGPVESSPAVSGSTVFVGSADGKLYAFTATGSPKWVSTATGGAVDSSPAVANGVVYVGSGDGALYAFPAKCTTACAPLGTFVTTAGVTVASSPAVADGAVYVGGDDGAVYSFGLP